MKSLICQFGLALALSSLLHAAPELEVAARLIVPPGNITVSPDGRMFISLHQFFLPKSRVVELFKDGRIRPFPSAAYNEGDRSVPGGCLEAVLGIQADKYGLVWMLDNGMQRASIPKLVAWDTRNDRLARIIYLPDPATHPYSFVNDLAVDPDHNAIYIADPGSGPDAALIVVELATGLARRVLQGHQSVVPEKELALSIDGQPVRVPPVGVNPIALDAKAEYLYFGPMHGRSLYRIRTEDLRNGALSAEELGEKVERYSDKPICDGITMDAAGRIYVTDVAANAIGVILPTKEYWQLVSDPRLSWPDSVALAPDGALFVIANQLQRSPRLNGGKNLAEVPFQIFRIANPTADGGDTSLQSLGGTQSGDVPPHSTQ